MEENPTEKMNGGPIARYDMGGLKLALCGLIFTAINIRIQGFDIVPDVIGYLIVIRGLGKIEKYEVKFSAAKKTAYVLAVLALFNIYQAPAWEHWGTEATGLGQTTQESVFFSAGLFGNIPWLAMLFLFAGMAASLYFTYSMCKAMKVLLNGVGDHGLAGVCDDRWKLILAAQIGLLVSLLTALLGVPFALILVMVFGSLALIALILFLLLVNRAYKSIDGKAETACREKECFLNLKDLI
ncbi:MAG: hypothetical protein PHC91_06415 [Eubacteriales bacterium]|nr:hypothetical protein [Eubacteriales bacterium]